MHNRPGPSRVKTCSTCKQEKPLEQFSLSRKATDGRDGRCKPCVAENRRRLKREGPKPTPSPDPKPARVLRESLARSRRDGLDFDAAWKVAVRQALLVGGETWAPSFAWARGAFERSYEHARTHRGEQLRIAPEDLHAA